RAEASIQLDHAPRGAPSARASMREDGGVETREQSDPRPSEHKFRNNRIIRRPPGKSYSPTGRSRYVPSVLVSPSHTQTHTPNPHPYGPSLAFAHPNTHPNSHPYVGRQAKATQTQTHTPTHTRNHSSFFRINSPASFQKPLSPVNSFRCAMCR